MPLNNKPCHNCRRRRLRCDRSWPTCNKCAVSGQECLGYGRVYVWTEGIDSQGKVKPSPGARRTPLVENHGVAGQLQRANPNPSPSPSPGPSLALRSGPPLLAPASAGAVRDRQPARRKAAQATQGPDPAAPPVHLPPDGGDQQQRQSQAAAYLAPSQLTDPIFQDLDRNSRNYLAHCKSNLGPATLPPTCRHH